MPAASSVQTYAAEGDNHVVTLKALSPSGIRSITMGGQRPRDLCQWTWGHTRNSFSPCYRPDPDDQPVRPARRTGFHSGPGL